MSERVQRRVQSLRRRRAMNGRLQARMHLEPGGGHMLELGIDGYPVTLTFGPQQVIDIKEAIGAYEQRADEIEDGALVFPRVERITS